MRIWVKWTCNYFKFSAEKKGTGALVIGHVLLIHTVWSRHIVNLVNSDAYYPLWLCQFSNEADHKFGKIWWQHVGHYHLSDPSHKINVCHFLISHKDVLAFISDGSLYQLVLFHQEIHSRSQICKTSTQNPHIVTIISPVKQAIFSLYSTIITQVCLFADAIYSSASLHC